MKTLCVDARMAHSAGIGTCIREIVPRLASSFHIILLVSVLDQPWCKGIEQIAFNAPIYSIREQLQFPFVVPKCDLFWSPHYNIPLLPIRAKKRIATIHDACHLALGKWLSFPERLYARFVMKRALHHSDAVITDSEFSKIELIRFLKKPKGPFEVIAPAVDPKQFSRISDPEILASVKDRYQLPEKFILFVGSQKPHKNLQGLLQAFSMSGAPDLHLVIVGKKQGLRNAIESVRMENVHWPGEVPNEDLSSLYTLAELFAFPSFYEGFGLPPLEAMSCGCPTIVSNAASLPEVCGDASYYVNPESGEEISQAISHVLRDKNLQATLIRLGSLRAKAYLWEKTARSYEALLLSKVFTKRG